MEKYMNAELNQIEKLRGSENYQMWKFQVLIHFEANELKDVVMLDPPEPKTIEWNRKNANAKRIIVMSLDKKIIMHIMNCNTAKDMWTKIKAVYERDNEQLKCKLLQEFFAYTYSKDMDVSTFISQLENMASRLNALDAKVTNDMLISKTLMSLPENFRYFISAWESSPLKERTLENLTARLLIEEARNSTEKTETDATAFETTEIRCYICNGTGHIAKYCKKRNNRSGTYNNKERMYSEKRNFNRNTGGNSSRMNTTNYRERYMSCSICKKNNHVDADCYFRNKTDRHKQTNVVSFLAHGSTENWIVDSGTTSHMVNDKKILKDIKPINTSIKVAKANEVMKAEGVGDVEFETCNLKQVVYVPQLTSNLLSVAAITDNGGDVWFTKEKVIIKKKNEEILRGNKTENGLYEVQMKLKTKESAYFIKEQSQVELWHRKLGHLGIENMKRLINMSDGTNILKKNIEEYKELCETCLRAKQTREKFGKERSRATRPLGLVHTDLCGPISPETWNKNRYILTFMDDYTHYTMIYLLKNKYEVTEKVKEYVNLVEAKWSLKLYKLRCDNGREYINTTLMNWCKQRGTQLDQTIPYTPQQNGRAERLNRTLIDRIRALLIDSKINKEMWGEAAYTATYLLNRSPTKALDRTPAEKWNGHRPNLKNIKLFGCKVFVKILEPQKNLDDRCKAYIFIGYAPNGYRIWDSNRRKIIIARDVEFDEKKLGTNGETTENNYIQLRISGAEDEVRNGNLDNEENNNVDEEMDTSGEYVEVNENIEEQENQTTRESQQDIHTDNTRPIRIRRQPKRYEDYYTMLTYEEAVTGADKKKWEKAIKEEKISLLKNNTWEVINRSDVKNKKLLTSRWVFKEKEDGTCKARLVIRGCQQKAGIDYTETFSPVIGNSSLRTLFAMAAMKKFKITTFDVKTAFLYVDEQ